MFTTFRRKFKVQVTQRITCDALKKLSLPSRVIQHVRLHKMYYKRILQLVLLAAICSYVNTPTWLLIGILFAAYLLTGGWKFLKIALPTVRRDLRGLIHLIRIMYGGHRHLHNNTIIPELFQETVKQHPNKTAFVFEGQKWTFQEAEDYSNRVANMFQAAGYKKGDVVALFLESRPELVLMWLGLGKIGVISALINFNLRHESLLHCINIANAKALVFSGDLKDAIEEIKDDLSEDRELYCTGSQNSSSLGARLIDHLLQSQSTKPPLPLSSKSFKDILLYIYTSGTTGLPKAAPIRNSRFYMMAYGMTEVLQVTPEDINYCALPLYHSAGGILGVGVCILGGATLVIRRKFSASKFWDDCVESKATMFQYIGEICRYLLAQPYRTLENQHKIRIAVGNGLRPQIWEEFRDRFKVPVISEFYGATEGNSNIVNFEGRVGSCGFTSIIAPWAMPLSLIRVDTVTGEIVRGKNGLAQICKPWEPGMLVGKIIKGDTVKQFDGYLNQQETSKKIAHDIFYQGDQAFLTGDLLVMDEYGYFYFQDRTGDTFRWKGENVATQEVESTLSKLVGLRDVAVYGVQIPGTEGRAGMAAIVDPDREIDLKKLARDMRKELPGYARPVFIRLCSAVDTTGTYKMQKVRLKKEEYNTRIITDDILYATRSGEYEKLTNEIYDDICNCKRQF